MKKLLFIAVSLALAFNVLATGVIQNNGPQSGTLTFNAATGLVVTNLFPVPYITPPVVTLSSTSTNNTPATISAVTLTNFVLTVTSNATTNNSFNWFSYAGYPRVQTGTNAITAGTFVTNTFAVPYFYPPTINLDGTATNAGVAVITTTATNFIESAAITQTVQWGAFGIAYQPGPNTVTY
jgi:hypothetical protein